MMSTGDGVPIENNPIHTRAVPDTASHIPATVMTHIFVDNFPNVSCNPNAGIAIHPRSI
jgi:hypothetical protein